MQQAHDRSQERIRDIESYLVLQRDTIGAKLAFALLDGEEDMLNDPSIEELENAAIDIISLSNVSVAHDPFRLVFGSPDLGGAKCVVNR